MAAAHTLCSYLLILYLIVHLYMATLGRFFAHTRAMITGYEDAAQPPGQRKGSDMKRPWRSDKVAFADENAHELRAVTKGDESEA